MRLCTEKKRRQKGMFCPRLMVEVAEGLADGVAVDVALGVAVAVVVGVAEGLAVGRHQWSRALGPSGSHWRSLAAISGSDPPRAGPAGSPRGLPRGRVVL